MSAPKPPYISHTEVLARLEQIIDQQGTLTLAARFLKISPQLLSAVLAEKRSIGPKLLKQLHLKRIVKKLVVYQAKGAARA